MNGKYYKHINLNDIRNDKYSKPIPIQNDIRYNYGAKRISLRASIEHCELHDVIKGLTMSLENCKTLQNSNVIFPTGILWIIDGKYKIQDESVMSKIEEIYSCYLG